MAQLVELVGREFDSRWGFFIDLILGSTQPRAEMSTRDISWGVKAAGT